MGRRNRGRVVDTVEVISNGKKEIFEVPEKEIKETLKKDETPKRIFTAKVNSQYDLVNIRRQPKGEIVAQVSKGIELRVLDINPKTDDDGNEWYNIVGPIGQEGWIMASLINIFEEGAFEEV